MTRREILAAVELAMAASALSAAVYGLVGASYNPNAAVQWVPIAVVGAGTALCLTAVAAILFVGRAALLLADSAVRARMQPAAPPPAAAPLWPVHTPTDALIEAYVAERAGGRRHAQPVTATPGPQTQRTPALDDTVRMAADDLAEWGAFEYGGTR